MKLFELNKDTYEIEIAAEALLLEPFDNIVKRDKSKTKDNAKKELAYVYHLCDIRSDYIGNEEEKKAQIIDNLGLGEDWEEDDVIKKAVALYTGFKTPVERLYEGAVISAMDVDAYLRMTNELLKERDDNGRVVTDIAKITGSLEKIPKIMANLKASEKELIKERKDNEGRKKGSKSMNMFEDGV